ncbi:TMAO reductase system periplasmic protein TorT [Vibrio sp. FNV 38]|nr:TMAO reductase system periplasmic protein TorT [Vibrio sp. FNV 38]
MLNAPFSLILSQSHRQSIALLLAVLCNTTNAWAQEPAKICAVYPHLKDSYWLSVNYGMVDEAKKQHVTLRVLESGSYDNLDKQQEQIKACREWQADAILLGSVSPTAYQHDLRKITGDIPVFAVVNYLDLDEKNRSLLKSTIGVDWHGMGYLSGEFLMQQALQKQQPLKVALLPGPKSSGGTKPVLQGFYDAISTAQDTQLANQPAINVVATYWGDNDKELQRNLIQKLLEKYDDIDYIYGSAVAVEAAISELRGTERENIGLIATYLSHGVYRGLVRHKVEFAPTDHMVLQGRASIRQALSFLTDNTIDQSIPITIKGLTPTRLQDFEQQQSLSPSEYRPTFFSTP